MTGSIHQLDWNDLRIFLAVSRSQHLTSVAKLLKVDQSTVSRRIAHLESSLGSRLIERKRERLILTEFGRKVVERLENMETHVSTIADMASGSAADDLPFVRISTYEGVSTFYLVERLAAFQRRQWRVEVVTQLHPVNVSLRDADIFVSFYEPDGRGLSKAKLGTITMHLYASQNYLDRNGTPRNRRDLESHEFISFIPELLALDEARFLDEAVPNRREVFNSTSMASQMAAAAAGVGLVMLPVFAARRERRLLPVLSQEIAVKREIWISTHQDMRYTPRIKTLIAYMTKIFKEDQNLFNVIDRR